MRYPSANLLLRKWTADRFPDLRVVTELPADLQTVIADVGAVIRIQRYGGSDQELTVDRADADVDVFAGSWAVADAVCGQVRDAWRIEMPGALVDLGEDGRGTVARVVTSSGPTQRPVTDSSLSRCGASFAVWVHAHAVADH